MVSLIYILLAVFALSFLIFIHELGHYLMARREGMRVEVFSIGMGKPLFSWEWDGVRWQIGWLFVGGYVKIAGMSTESEEDPSDVPDGFFAKTPWQRIKVAAMGPIVNIVFAFIAFSLIWTLGGRYKTFGEFTPIVGWVDDQSELFAEGVRPGDEIVSFDGNAFTSARDHLFVAIAGSDEISIKGNHVDPLTGKKTPFEKTVKRYPHPSSLRAGIQTTGITSAANYMIYDRFPNGQDNPLPEGSPLEKSGIAYGDRLYWVDGEVIYSLKHLWDVLNDGRALLTVRRGNQTLLRRVPRVSVRELRPDAEFREELTDWKFDAELEEPYRDLYMIPYNLTHDGVVEAPLNFLEKENQTEAFPKNLFSSLDAPLESGDKVIGVDGVPTAHPSEILAQIQKKQVHAIVERDPKIVAIGSLQQASDQFIRPGDATQIAQIAQSIGTGSPLKSTGSFVLLEPIEPKKRIDFFSSEEDKLDYLNVLKERQRALENRADRADRPQIERAVELEKKRLLLGFEAQAQDRTIRYNPPPTTLFFGVFDEIWRTLSALFTGALSTKWMVGPIGIVYSVQQQSMVSLMETLFWLGLISLNLGILNLLPIPILDGGTIVFCFLEMITGKKLKPQTLEKLVVPFALLLIGFFLYITYNDIIRIFGNFFRW